MKIKWFIVFFLQIILTGVAFCQKGEPIKPIIDNSIRSSSEEYIISDFVDINPNPFDDIINIEILEKGEQSIQIDILSIVGKTVASLIIPSQSNITLNLSELEKGIYLLKINNGKFSCVKRIVHQ
jgi:hypothetical protein